MYFGYKALTFIPLSLASTIGFTKVFFASLMSWFILKERLNKKFFSCLLGFSGVYFITLPSTVSEIEESFSVFFLQFLSLEELLLFHT